jgi:hypothetical protein
MQRDDSSLFTLPFTAVRLTQLNQLVLICIRNSRGILPPSRFTLHSVLGLALPGGRLQIERIAGFCHARGCLKSYAAEQINALQDPETAGVIDDLRLWLESRRDQDGLIDPEPAQGASEKRVAARQAAAKMRDCNTVALAIEKAIVCASSRGLADVATRLSGLLETLEGQSTINRCRSMALLGQRRVDDEMGDRFLL